MMQALNLKTRKGSIMDQPTQKIMVGVAGGSAAGKTTLCQNIFRQMAFDRNFKVEIISLDSFYKDIDKSIVTDVSQYNFDHPNALDFDLAYKTLKNLMDSNQKVEIPQYSFITHSRLKQPAYVGPANVIFFEGLMSFYDKRIRDLMTYKIFINCDDDIRLCRRLKRDTAERGRSVISVLQQYNKFVKNAFRDFILPSQVYADIIIPGFRNNRVSVDFIVQHIKNMARKITFKQKASKTKMFIFGDGDLYDMEYEDNDEYESKVITAPQAFLVFPTSDQHKKQLEFFLGCLLSQIFSIQYFVEVYLNQFVKVLKSLLKQLIALKNFKPQKMQILSVYNIEQIVKLRINEYPIKVIFYPVAAAQHSKNILIQIKQYLEKHPNVTFIIMNAFCDMNVPRMIYKFKLSNVILINLFIVANEKRFRQTMTNNLSVSTDNYDWFNQNHDIAQIGCHSIAKQCDLHETKEIDIAKRCYNSQIQNMKVKKILRKIDQNQQKIGNIQQHQVLPQQHGNLCGYHALSTLLCIQEGKDINNRDNFINNYHNLANSVGKLNYLELQRSDLEEILQDKALMKSSQIGVLIYSFKYIQSTQEQIDELDGMFELYHKGEISQFYIITAVVDHYTLVRINKGQIHYYDSENFSLSDIMNQTHSQLDKYQPGIDKSTTDYKNYANRMEYTRQLFQIIQDLMNKKKTVMQILIEKRIEDIVLSFNQIKDQTGGVQKWLKQEYPKPVIKNDLMKFLHQRKIEISKYHKQLMHNWLKHQKINKMFPQDQHKLLF